MTVIQFPPAKGPLDFDGMGIKIDIKKQRESWDAAFMSVQFARIGDKPGARLAFSDGRGFAVQEPREEVLNLLSACI